ncbi:glycerate kinase [Agrococcus sp. SCSIO52902]|uniref:glycerate kinase n=1 Tax=Agrococcus sp. SCSIO52902 TaxID=2933290 RepID=UPI001FF464DA|nr:glycerate kinase [Agrococcus sp. SCSIO52902]UOW00191.1 glycerate kinase [Agrococcus sp. SCSIO52902]
MTAAPQRAVVAFDAFKGSLTALEACEAAARGIRSVVPGAEVVLVPMADGGEGSLDALLARGGDEVVTETVDAIGRPARARWALDGRSAVIELAQAAGLPQVEDAPLQPLAASTAGLGRVVLDALDRGAAELTLLLGGSATSDGGAGLLTALGARLTDASGRPVQPGGGGLAALEHLDVSGVDPRALAARWRFVTDVDAPLTGPRGAAAVFGPQKGAGPDDVRALDAALERFARIGAEALGVDAASVIDVPGSGAAGGVASVLRALTGGDVVAGGAWFAELAGLDAAVPGADLVLTGEGRFDGQSAGGKVVSVVHAAAERHGVPLCVLAGSVDADAAAAMGVPALSIAAGPATLDALQRDAGDLLAAAAASVARLALGAARLGVTDAR